MFGVLPGGFMKVLVCGGRHYRNRQHLFNVLEELWQIHQFDYVIHGGATGADELAGAWAVRKGIPVIVCKADWDGFGKAAGPIRNKEMLDLNPDLVVSFPGGKGTSNMVKQALERHFVVIQEKE